VFDDSPDIDICNDVMRNWGQDQYIRKPSRKLQALAEMTNKTKDKRNQGTGGRLKTIETDLDSKQNAYGPQDGRICTSMAYAHREL
jgi:hypothetical protein